MRIPTIPLKNNRSERGSGTADVDVYAISSITSELPAGSPVIVTLEMPPVKLN